MLSGRIQQRIINVSPCGRTTGNQVSGKPYRTSVQENNPLTEGQTWRLNLFGMDPSAVFVFSALFLRLEPITSNFWLDVYFGGIVVSGGTLPACRPCRVPRRAMCVSLASG